MSNSYLTLSMLTFEALHELYVNLRSDTENAVYECRWCHSEVAAQSCQNCGAAREAKWLKIEEKFVLVNQPDFVHPNSYAIDVDMHIDPVDLAFSVDKFRTKHLVPAIKSMAEAIMERKQELRRIAFLLPQLPPLVDHAMRASDRTIGMAIRLITHNDYAMNQTIIRMTSIICQAPPPLPRPKSRVSYAPGGALFQHDQSRKDVFSH